MPLLLFQRSLAPRAAAASEPRQARFFLEQHDQQSSG
jgi:hypothetical protein